MADPGDLVRRAGRPRLRRKKGAIVALYTAPPAGSVVICLDEMGPESGQELPRPRGWSAPEPAERHGGRGRPQEIDYGRRGKGYIFGAFRPATGEALTAPYAGRTTANWVDFLEQVEAWVPAEVERVYAILDNLSTHRAPDVLLFGAGPPALGVRLPADVRRLPQPDRADQARMY